MLENAWYGNIWMHFKRWSWATTRGRAGETPRSSLLETLLMAPLMMSSGRVLKGLDPFGLIIMKVWFYLKLGNISPPLKLGRCLSVMAGLSRLMWWLTRTLALFMSTLAWVRTPVQKHHILKISWFFPPGRGKINDLLRELHGAELNGNKLRVQLSTSGVRQSPGMGGDECFKYST